MKKYSYLLCLFFLFSFASCLKSNLDDLPEFEENDITGVQKVEYRYVNNETSSANGQNKVKFVGLDKMASIDKKGGYVGIEVTVPAANQDFPETERTQCSTKELAVMVSLSTAARITPVGNAPLFGTPGDWSKPNKYIIEAANGDKREWTVEIIRFTK